MKACFFCDRAIFENCIPCHHWLKWLEVMALDSKQPNGLHEVEMLYVKKTIEQASTAISSKYDLENDYLTSCYKRFNTPDEVTIVTDDADNDVDS